MAYNNGYYTPYQNQYMSQMQIPQMVQQQMQQPQMQPQMQQPVQQLPPQQAPQYPVMQNGFVRVPSENDARMYPVAPGTSVTFIDENQPYCYTKTMDRSQLDRPQFRKYRLVEEADTPVASQNTQEHALPAQEVDLSGYVLKTDLDVFKDEIEDSMISDIKALQSDLKNLRDRVEILAEKKAPAVRKDAGKE